jgi:hypothetical protein
MKRPRVHRDPVRGRSKPSHLPRGRGNVRRPQRAGSRKTSVGIDALPRIFVSYARMDGKRAAAQIQRRLRDEHGFALWRDLTDLESGKDWIVEIKAAIDAVEYLILVITPGALKSEIVEWEWRYARKQGVCVIPVVGSQSLDIRSLPHWLKRHSFVAPGEPEQWMRMVRTLEGPCRAIRVPFMAGELPRSFVPRTDLLSDLKLILLDQKTGEAVPTAVGVKGAPAFGKSTVCKALCRENDILEAFYDGILWVTLGPNPGALIDSVSDLIETLTNARPGFRSLEASVARFAELLADRRILIVIDDVWKSEHLTPFLQGGVNCARVITTRISDVLPGDARAVQVGSLRPEEGLALLMHGLPERVDATAADLVHRLGYWPLVLSLVNSVLRKRVLDSRQPTEGALEAIRETLRHRGLSAFDSRDARQRDQAVSVAVDLSLALLDRDEVDRFKQLAIFPWDQNVPMAALALLWRFTHKMTERETEDFVTRLLSLSLISDLDLSTGELRVNQVLAQYLRDSNRVLQPAFHSMLVKAYEESRDSAWRNGPTRRYFLRNLSHHLYESGDFDSLLDLPSNEWRRLKRSEFGSNVSFLRDLDMAAAAARRLPFRRAVPQLMKISAMFGRVDNADQQLPEGALEAMSLLGEHQRALERIGSLQMSFEIQRRAEIIRGLAALHEQKGSAELCFKVAFEGLDRLTVEEHPGSRSYGLSTLLSASPITDHALQTTLLEKGGAILEEIQKMPGHENWGTPSVAAEYARLWIQLNPERASQSFSNGLDFLHSVTRSNPAQVWALDKLLAYWAQLDPSAAAQAFLDREWLVQSLPIRGLTSIAEGLGDAEFTREIVRVSSGVVESKRDAMEQMVALVNMGAVQALLRAEYRVEATLGEAMVIARQGVAAGQLDAEPLVMAAKLFDRLGMPSHANDALSIAWSVMLGAWSELPDSELRRVIDTYHSIFPDELEGLIQRLEHRRMKAAALALYACDLAMKSPQTAKRKLEEALELQEHPRPIGTRGQFYISFADFLPPAERAATEKALTAAFVVTEGDECIHFALSPHRLAAWRVGVLSKLTDSEEATDWLKKISTEWPGSADVSLEDIRTAMTLSKLPSPLPRASVDVIAADSPSAQKVVIHAAVGAAMHKEQPDDALRLLDEAYRLADVINVDRTRTLMFSFLAACWLGIDQERVRPCLNKALFAADRLDRARSDETGRQDDLLEIASTLLQAEAASLALPVVLASRDISDPPNVVRFKAGRSFEDPDYDWGMGRRERLLAEALSLSLSRCPDLVKECIDCLPRAAASFFYSNAVKLGTCPTDLRGEWSRLAYQCSVDVKPHEVCCLLKADAAEAMSQSGDGPEALTIAKETVASALDTMRRTSFVAGFTRVTNLEQNYAHAIGKCLLVFAANGDLDAILESLSKIHVVGHDSLFVVYQYIPSVLLKRGDLSRESLALIQTAEEQAWALFH